MSQPSSASVAAAFKLGGGSGASRSRQPRVPDAPASDAAALAARASNAPKRRPPWNSDFSFSSSSARVPPKLRHDPTTGILWSSGWGSKPRALYMEYPLGAGKASTSAGFINVCGSGSTHRLKQGTTPTREAPMYRLSSMAYRGPPRGRGEHLYRDAPPRAPAAGPGQFNDWLGQVGRTRRPGHEQMLAAGGVRV